MTARQAQPNLSGRRVLVPVTPGRRALADKLDALGARVDAVEFISIEPPMTLGALDSAAARWCAHEFAWLAVTSRNAVGALADAAARAGISLADPQPDARVATVGESTLGACRALDLEVSLVPESDQSARGLVEVFPAPIVGVSGAASRVLAPLGSLAADTLARGLEALGWEVVTVEAYRTVDGQGPDAEVVHALASGAVDAVLLTSASAAERLRRDCPDMASGTMVVAIGENTVAGATACGLTVDAVAENPTYEAMVQALADCLGMIEEES